MFQFAKIFDYGTGCFQYTASEHETTTLSLYNLYRQGAVVPNNFLYQGACPAGGVADGPISDLNGYGTMFQRYRYDLPSATQNASILLLL